MFIAQTARPAKWFIIKGGQGRNRTADASLFRAALYQLSYLASQAGNHQFNKRSIVDALGRRVLALVQVWLDLIS
jgi:hypothetical protein